MTNKEKVLIQKERPTVPFSVAAKWAYLRLVYGRKIDREINRQNLDKYFNDAAMPSRDLQYIISNNTVKAVASMNHDIMYPADVREEAIQIAKRFPVSIEKTPAGNLIFKSNKLTKNKFFGGVYPGIALNPGTLTLTRAIIIAPFFLVKECFNPLNALHLKSKMFGTFRVELQSRILRINAKSMGYKELLRAELKALARTGIPKSFMHNARRPLSLEDATISLKVLCRLYGIGKKIQEEALTMYSSSSKKTIFEFAMIISKIAGDNDIFSKNAVVAPERLSTIATIYLAADSEELLNNSRQYVAAKVAAATA